MNKGSHAHARAADGLLFAALVADNAVDFCRALAAYLAQGIGTPMRVLDDLAWQECEQKLSDGQADLGVVCGLQYVQAVDRGDVPGIELLAAPVMRGPRYANLPIYFSEVVVRKDDAAWSLSDLRGATWAYNEPTSHSGYAITRYVLARRGERAAFFGRVFSSGAHLRSLQLLLNGAIDATAIDSTVLEQELRVRPALTDQIRVIETLGPSPIPPLVLSRALPDSVRNALRAAVLSMHTNAVGQAVLASAHITKFVTVADADYEPIRRMAQIAAETEPWFSTEQLADARA